MIGVASGSRLDLRLAIGKEWLLVLLRTIIIITIVAFCMQSTFATQGRPFPWSDAHDLEKRARVARLLERAREFVRSNKYPQAVALLKDAADIEATYRTVFSARASYLLARLYEKQNMVAEALAAFRSVFIWRPYAGDVEGGFADTCQWENNFIAPITEYASLLARHGMADEAKAMYYYALRYYLAGVPRAIEPFWAKPEWTQPDGTKVLYFIDHAAGCFLNTDEELGTPPSPRSTLWLPPDRQALVAAQGLGEDFQLGAAYSWSETPGVVNEIMGVHATDWTTEYKLASVKEDTEEIRSYCIFRVHRPTDAKEWPDAAIYDTYMNRWYPPAGNSGGALFYQLIDGKGKGMPGVWIQERFQDTDPSHYPPNARVNRIMDYWTTQRRFSEFKQPMSWQNFFNPFVFTRAQTPKDADGVFGPDYLWISNDWWDTHQGAFTLSGHQYWAGTKDTSRTSTWGILVGEYTITIPKNGYCSQGR